MSYSWCNKIWHDRAYSFGRHHANWQVGVHLARLAFALLGTHPGLRYIGVGLNVRRMVVCSRFRVAPELWYLLVTFCQKNLSYQARYYIIHYNTVYIIYYICFVRFLRNTFLTKCSWWRSDIGVDPFAYGEDTSPESRMRQANLQPCNLWNQLETKRREITGSMKHTTFGVRGVWVTKTLLIPFLHVALVRIPIKDPYSTVEFSAFVLISPCAACAVAWLGTLSWGGWCGDSVEVVNWI